MRIYYSILPLFVLLALPACGSHQIKPGQYWQRIQAADAVYTQGPKAQQMLNRDIAACVVELRELERLGSLRDTIPTDTDGRVLDPDELAVMDRDAPSHHEYLLAEHGNFHDFETCMREKGWERVKHVPFDVAEQALINYAKVHPDYDYDFKSQRVGPKQHPPAYADDNNFND